MRVLYISKGHLVHDRRFLCAMLEQGHEVSFMRFGDSVSDWEVPRGVVEIPTSASQSGTAPDRERDIKRASEQAHPHIVHVGPILSHGSHAVSAGVRPLVSMSWGSDLLLDASQDPERVVAQDVLTSSSVLLCDCEAVKERAIELAMDPDRIAVFPWGVDLEHFSPGASGVREQLRWHDQLVLISSRPWMELYGIEILIDGFMAAYRSAPQLRLLLLNSGPLETRVKSALENAGLSDAVHFAGTIAQDQLPQYYRAADLYLSASRSDGSSVSLLEAMACGLPAIVSDIPGNREWVEPGRNGWLFEDGNSAALTQRILEAASAERARGGYSQAARGIAERRADWSVNALKLTEAYELALEAEAA